MPHSSTAKKTNEVRNFFVMKPIPIEIVLKDWREHSKQSDAEMFVSLKYLYFVQPFLMKNIMLTDDDGPLNLEERQTLYHLGGFILQVMMRQNPGASQVKETDMEPVEKRVRAENILKLAGEDPCKFLERLDRVLILHNQMDLLTFVWQNLVSLNEKNSNGMRNHSAVLIFTFLRIVLEALDSAQPAFN